MVDVPKGGRNDRNIKSPTEVQLPGMYMIINFLDKEAFVNSTYP